MINFIRTNQLNYLLVLSCICFIVSSEISNFKLDFHNVLQDPEYRDKCMKGNYKWASMKFQQIKSNLAKRKGISIENFQMPKIYSKKSFNMEMNAKLILNKETKTLFVLKTLYRTRQMITNT